MITFIATLTILIACTIGAIVGFGGGIIIKPVLDSMAFCTIDTVNFISSCAVLAMSISSIIRHKIQKTSFDKKIVLLCSAGAVIGGFCGNNLFHLAVNNLNNNMLKAIQAIMIIGFVGFALYYINKKDAKTFKISNPVALLLTGLMLGTLNSFLGIGGGPINMTMLLLFFSLSVKDGAIYSISIVFFCQLTNLATLFINNQFSPYKEQFPLVICAVIAAVCGGLIGSTLNKKFNEKVVRYIFTGVMIFVFGINIYNTIRGFI